MWSGVLFGGLVAPCDTKVRSFLDSAAKKLVNTSPCCLTSRLRLLEARGCVSTAEGAGENTSAVGVIGADDVDEMGGVEGLGTEEGQKGRR